MGFQTEPDEALLAALREQVIDLDPLYLLFTSGSTGTPKGIVIPHRAMIDLCRLDERILRLHRGRRLRQSGAVLL